MMIIDNKFEIGQTVYLRTDPDQAPLIVVQLTVTPSGILYTANAIEYSGTFYDIELSEERVLAI